MRTELFSKLSRLLNGRRGLNEDLTDEIEAHLGLVIDDNIARGMSPEEARAAARRQFGNPTLTRERAWETWQFPRFESVLQDVRYSLRGIRRKPAFFAAVVLTLALGVGANTAIFSAVYNVLLRPLPYPNGERLVWLGESTGSATGISVTWINFQHWKNENRVFDDMAAFVRTDQTLTGRGEAILTHGGMVTSSFFRMTGEHPLTGRLFTEADDHIGAPPVVVLTHEFWTRKLQADPAVLGSMLALNGKPYQIIGILQPGLGYLGRTDYYLPLGPSAGKTVNRGAHGSIRALGLLKPGVTMADARANLNAIMQRLALSDPGSESDHRAYSEYLTESITGDVRRTLLMLMAAAGLLLFIACANVASLLLVRGAARSREIAVRSAIGAGRQRLARQLITENLTIAACGGVLGLIVAQLCLWTLIRMAPASLPRLAEISLNIPVLLFAAAVTLITGLVAALAPVFASRQVDVSSALKDGAPGSGNARRGHGFRGALVVAEIAITLVLSFASGLLIRSLIAAQTSYPGFDSHNLLALELQLPSSVYKNDQQARQFYTRLMEDLRRERGVEDVGAVVCPPSAGDCGDWFYSIVGKPAPARADVPLTLFTMADPGYFRTMRIQLLAGRAFNDGDRAGGQPVTIINEEIARKWWPTPQAAIGQLIKFGGPFMEGNVMEVVGVSARVSQMGLDGEAMPQMYFPFAQEGGRALVVMLRTNGDPASLIPMVRRHVTSLDANLPIQSLRPFEQWMGTTLTRRRFGTLLLGLFAGLAMLLAAIGVYGVLNYWVSVRNKEIAVRMALGAQRSAILRWAGSHAMRLALAGVVLGVAGAWAASRWMESVVYGVSVRNPGMLLGAAAVVIAMATIAASLPLWRASRVDVVRNLHDA